MNKQEYIICNRIMKLIRFVLFRVIKPDITVKKVSDLNVEEIERIKEEYGIKAIILDVDKTLRKNKQGISKVNSDWIESLKGKVKIIILSNGLDKSIEQFFADRGIDYIGFACKPFKRNFIEACKRLDVRPENTMVLGNSWFFDIFGANRSGMRTGIVTGFLRGVE